MNWKTLIFENLKQQCISSGTKFDWFGDVLRIQKGYAKYFSLTFFNLEAIEKIRKCNPYKTDASIVLVCSYLLTEHEFSQGEYVRFIEIPDILFCRSLK